jgi:hypothetical protein
VRRQAAQLRRDGRELRKARALGFGQRFEGGLRAGEERRAVREPRLLGAYLIPLAFPGRQLLQVADALAQVGVLGFARGEILLRLDGYLLQALPGAAGLGGLACELLGAGVRVEQAALRRRPQKRLVRVLAVDVDQEFAGLPQLSEGSRMAVDEAARAPCPVDGPSEDQAARIAGEVVLVDLHCEFCV